LAGSLIIILVRHSREDRTPKVGALGDAGAIAEESRKIKNSY